MRAAIFAAAILASGTCLAQEASDFIPAGSLADMHGATMCDRLDPLLEILNANAHAAPADAPRASTEALQRWDANCARVDIHGLVMALETVTRVDGVRTVHGDALTVWVVEVADANGRRFFATSLYPVRPAPPAGPSL